MNRSIELQPVETVAVFDFDGTLTTRGDTLLPFLQRVVGRRRLWSALVALTPVLAGYALGRIPNWRAKEALLVRCLEGYSAAELARLGEQFAQEELCRWLNPAAVERLRFHQRRGDRTVLISASLEVYLQPWGRLMGFDAVLGTRLALVADQVSGRIAGRNCYGPEKVERLRQWLGNPFSYELYAYGDSRGDRELLACVDYPFYRTFTPDSTMLIPE